MGYWPVVKKVMKDSDVILLILDARMVEVSRDREFERRIRQYKSDVVLVINKIDLVSRKFLDHLRKRYRRAFFVSGTKNIGMGRLRENLMIRAKRSKKEDFSVGVLGYPNMGKSAVINALTRRGRAKVSNVAGTTKGIQWISLGDFRLLDSPGIIPFRDDEVKLGLLGAKNPEKLRNLDKVAYEIIEMFLEGNKEGLEKHYGVVLKDKMDEDDIFLEIGKKKGFLVKKGEIDENRTALRIVRDWQNGKLRI